jgi:hypothetical protein
MTTDKPDQTQDQGTKREAGYQQEPTPTTEQEVLKAIQRLFEEATKQAKEVRPPELDPAVQRAATEHNSIKQALRTPTQDERQYHPLTTNDKHWELPKLNETAKKPPSPPASGSPS